jgi:hypothetical protein
MVAGALQVVEQLLDARLVRDRRMRVGFARPRLGRILAAQAMDVEQLLGSLVMRLELVVADRPGRSEAVLMTDLAEVLLAEAEQHRTVKL